MLVNQNFNANKADIRCIDSNAADSLLLSADDAGEVKFWEMKSGKLECIGGLSPSTVGIV